ncbi:MAG: hypothetical protein QXH27_03345 [Candidatus Micrarchaeia archaeon]
MLKSLLLALGMSVVLSSAEEVSFSVTVTDAPTTLFQQAVPSSLSSPGWVSLACGYRYEGGTVPNGRCSILVDSSSYDAAPPAFARSVFLSAGNHSWRCDCSADGFAPQSGQPQRIEVGSAQPSPSPEERALALQLVAEANDSVARARESGLDTEEAEGYVRLAALALAQNDTVRASSFAVSAKTVAAGAPPKSAVFVLESFSRVAAPAITIAALAIVIASLYFFRTYLRNREAG